MIVTQESRDAFVMSVALLKRNALSAPFERAFQEQKKLETSGGQGELMQIHYRDEEAIYVQASPDRVTVIFSTIFREETDRIFGKVFLQVGIGLGMPVPMVTLHRLNRSSLMPEDNLQFRMPLRCSTRIVTRPSRSAISRV